MERDVVKESILECLEYSRESGIVRWKKSRRRGWVGKVAGTTNKQGYVYIKIGGRVFPITHAIWVLVHGRFPGRWLQIDHINGVRNDNRLCNLREVTDSENCLNREARKRDGTSGK